MRSRDVFRPLISCAVATALAIPGAGFAQGSKEAADTIGLEEITITARKVEENLMSVPIAITAFSAKDIENANIKQLNDVMLRTPSFNFVNQQGGSGRNDRSTNALVFRGLYLGSNIGLSAGGSLFIDGAPVVGSQPPAINDVERIEVLKGPQSAYFGRNTFAGAINFVTRDPSTSFKGRLNAEASSWQSYDTSVSVEGSLTDTLSARVTARSFDRGGQYTNFGDPGGSKLGGQTTQSVSTTLVFKPSESFKIKAYLNAFRDNDGPPAQGALKSESFTGRVYANGNCIPFSQAPAGTAALGQAANSRASFGYVCGTVPKIKDLPAYIISGDWDLSSPVTRATLFTPPNPAWAIFDTSFNTHGGFKREAFQSDVRADYEFGGGYTFTSLTAAHRDKTMTLIDLNYRDGHDRKNPLNAIPANASKTVAWQQFLLVSQSRFEDWSQEFRITSPQEAKFRWTAGANYFDGKTPGGTVYGNSVIGPLFAAAITEQKVQTPAYFAAVYYNITDQITLSAEGRYQTDKLTQIPKVGVSGAVVTGLAATPLKATFKSFSPRFTVDYQITPDTMVYALYSKGVRPGGFNAGLVTAAPATVDALKAVVPTAGITYDEEELENREVGIKSTLFDGRARVTLTYFDDQWKNGQVQNSVPVTAGGVTNLIGLTINNGVADLKGLEFEGQLQATRNLKLSATFGYNKTELVSYGLGAGQCGDCNFIYGSFGGAIGKALPTAPKITYTLGAEYGDKINGDYDWFGRADWMHQGEKYTDFTNVLRVGAQNTLNASIGLRSKNVTLELFGKNLTDDSTMNAALLGIDAFTFLLPPNKNEVRFSPPLPRSFGVRLLYNF